MFRAVPLACALAVGGCSFVLVKPAPPPPEPCTRGKVAPTIDTAAAVLAAIGAIYFATSDGDQAAVGAVVEVALAAGFGASAYVGWRRVERCRARPAPSPLPPPVPTPPPGPTR